MKRKKIKPCFPLFLLWAMAIGHLTTVQAQQDSGSWHLSAAYNYLYSTHDTKFRGPAVVIDKSLSEKWDIGVGVGYNDCPYHPDNGYDLKNLKLIPLYGIVQYNFSKYRLFDPYLIFKTGITWMQYDQRWQQGNEPYTRQHETGWYCYAGYGARVNLKTGWQLFANIGMIGYKMSFNDLDINPHGVAGDMGCRIKL